jgi:hypothetical protein
LIFCFSFIISILSFNTGGNNESSNKTDSNNNISNKQNDNKQGNDNVEFIQNGPNASNEHENKKKLIGKMGTTILMTIPKQ